MARTHGRLLCSIWDDPDFLALEPGPQRLYAFLVSQKDLNHAGLISLRERRWSRSAAALTREQVAEDLTALAAARFVLVDEDTEEVLVRTLVRNDGIWKQPKLMVRLVEDAAAITSKRLRSAFLAELDRLPLEELSDEPGKHGTPSQRSAVTSAINAIRTQFGVDPMPTGKPSEGVSDTHPDTLPDTHHEALPDTDPGTVSHARVPAPSPSPRPPTPKPPAAATRVPAREEPPPLPPAVAELRDRLAEVKITPRWDKLTPEHLAQLEQLVATRALTALVKAAQAAHIPDRPAAFAQALIGPMLALPEPQARRRDPALDATDRTLAAVPSEDVADLTSAARQAIRSNGLAGAVAS